MPSRRSVPGVLPDSWLSLAMSRTSSAKLEGGADPLPVLGEDVHHGLLGAGHHRAEPPGHGHQRAGLARDDLQVVVEGVAAVARADGLHDLTGDQAFEGLGLDAYGLGSQVGQDVRGAGEEEVAGEDGHRVAPAGVGARHSAADIGLVHDVVVVERGQVGQLHDDGGRHHAGRVRVAELCPEHHEHGPEALAPCLEEVSGGVRDEGDVALGGLQQALLDGRETGLDVRIKGLVPHAQPEGPDDGHEGYSCR